MRPRMPAKPVGHAGAPREARPPCSHRRLRRCRAIRLAARRDPTPSASPGVQRGGTGRKPSDRARHRVAAARATPGRIDRFTAVPAPGPQLIAAVSRRPVTDRCRPASRCRGQPAFSSTAPTSPSARCPGADAAQPRHLGAHAIELLAAVCNHWPICPPPVITGPRGMLREFSAGAAHGGTSAPLGRRCRCLGMPGWQASVCRAQVARRLAPRRPDGHGRRRAVAAAHLDPLQRAVLDPLDLTPPPHQRCPASGSARPVSPPGR